MYSKDMSFPDAPIVDPFVKEQRGDDFIMNGPFMHEWLREMRREALGE
jgi:hypothetical protein